MNAPVSNRRTLRLRVSYVVAVFLLLALVPSCGLLRAPRKAVHAVTPGSKGPMLDPAQAESLVQQLADAYTLRTSQALDEYARILGTRDAALVALRWKALLLSNSIRIAGGNNPYGNLVDMVATINLNRSALEDYWVPSAQGAAFVPWLEASRLLDTNAWQFAAIVFPATQVKELRKALNDYRRTHPSAKYPLFARPLDFASSLKTTGAGSNSGNSLFRFVGFDTSMGLDPAVEEVTRTRLFAERAMYTAQRMPTLMRLQMEILAEDVLHQPELQQTLTNTTRIAESADRISRTAAELPDRITSERVAIVQAMEQQEGKLRELTAEAGRSLAQAEKTSDSLNITITSLDGLVKRFGVSEPNINRLAALNTTSQRFRILDYAETAEKVGGMASNLTVLIARVDQSTPQMTQLSQQAAADARQLVNHAFRLGLILIGALLIGAVLACLLYRILANRFLHNK